MTKEYARIKKCAEAISGRTDIVPEIAVVLGSGLGVLKETPELEIDAEISYHELEGFPVSTVSGHQGKFILGRLGGTQVVLMDGRVHYYEGYPMEDVVLPIRVIHELGAKRLVLTNAAGGINPDFKPGDLMLITDHIAQLVPSPLRGENIEEIGTRFPDMTDIYTKDWRADILELGAELGVNLKQGVYVQASGPSYESPAEIKMFAGWGADAVGMSTACEAIAARHMGMKICGISCITNMAAGLSKTELNHQEVKDNALKAQESFKKLVAAICMAKMK